MEVRYFFQTRDIPVIRIQKIILDRTKFFHQSAPRENQELIGNLWQMTIFDSILKYGLLCVISLHSRYVTDMAEQLSISYESNYDNQGDMDLYHIIHEFIVNEIQKQGIELE